MFLLLLGPGTGKTKTIVNMILEINKYGRKYLGRNMKFLVCSISNTCINEITLQLLEKTNLNRKSGQFST